MEDINNSTVFWQIVVAVIHGIIVNNAIRVLNCRSSQAVPELSSSVINRQVSDYMLDKIAGNTWLQFKFKQHYKNVNNLWKQIRDA